MKQRSPPFGLEESQFLTPPKLPATDDVYPTAMSLNSVHAEKAQITLGTKYVFSANQWLMFYRKAEGRPTARSGLRNIVQIGTVHTCLTGKYQAQGEIVKLNRHAMKQSAINTRIYDMVDMMDADWMSEESLVSDNSNLSSMTENLDVSENGIRGPRVIVVEGDILSVSLQLRKLFKHTPCAEIPINNSIPGGFYRRGGLSLEENVCRRSNLWDCLDDPYYHSQKQERDVETPPRSIASSQQWTSLTFDDLPSNTIQKKHSMSKSYGSIDKKMSRSGKISTKRSWSYPIKNTQGLFVPDVQVFRDEEANGYAFLKNPGRVSMICVVPDMIRDYVETNTAEWKQKLSNNNNKKSRIASTDPNIWKILDNTASNQIEEMFMKSKAVKAYREKIEFVIRMAIKEERKILVLGALGCGAHGVPPQQAAEIHKRVLKKVDPKGEHFTLVAFAILEDTNSFKKHNPLGNLKPFADILTGGVFVHVADLEKELQSLIEADLMSSKSKNAKLSIDFNEKNQKMISNDLKYRYRSRNDGSDTLYYNVSNSKLNSPSKSKKDSRWFSSDGLEFRSNSELNYDSNKPLKLGLLTHSQVELSDMDT